MKRDWKQWLCGGLTALAIAAGTFVGTDLAMGGEQTSRVGHYLGLGQCTKVFCNCRRFEGYGYTCSNCGHNSTWHAPL